MHFNGKAEFDFLGNHIQQFSASNYWNDKDSPVEILGQDTLITPLKKASKAHQETIGRIIRKHSSSPQAALIKGYKSPYHEALAYWSTRKGKHPKMPNRKAKLNNRVNVLGTDYTCLNGMF